MFRVYVIFRLIFRKKDWLVIFRKRLLAKCRLVKHSLVCIYICGFKIHVFQFLLKCLICE